MDNLTLLETLVPEFKTILFRRYSILKAIDIYSPIGRRSLTHTLGLTERQIRNDTDFLKESGLIDFNAEGNTITTKGIEFLDKLKIFIDELGNAQLIQTELAKLLNIKKVYICEKLDQNPEKSLQILGRTAARVLEGMIDESTVLGLTGGSSVYSLVKAYNGKKNNSITVVSARGGLGHTNRLQANTLVEELSKKLGGSFLPLYTPDFLSEESISKLLEEPLLKKTIEEIEKIDTLIFGIGQAHTMASRRNLEQNEINKIIKKGAVAESFGYYFNGDGQIVHEIPTIGIKLEKVKELKNIIAIAGSNQKARAIIAICKLNPNLTLVTDESAVNEIYKIFKEEKHD
jgi:central glycolytic genes regulator